MGERERGGGKKGREGSKERRGEMGRGKRMRRSRSGSKERGRGGGKV